MRILLGLSGGVDSAVAAYILKKQGHDVTCAFMRNWDAYANNDILGNPTGGLDDICPQEEDYLDAKKVADKLGLSLLRVDFVKEYWDDVFSVFLEETKKGRTPNPDILCNRHIKFSAFFKYARSMGFEWVATGHYARVVHHEGKNSLLLRGLDVNKDQTYFLVQVPQEALNHTLFPVGELTKAEVRKIALELDLSVAQKKDSTGICFIGERHFREFLHNYIPKSPGKIVDIDSDKIIGEHHGVMFYTLGQRKGMGIGGVEGPWFVVHKDLKSNTLYVAAKEDNDWLKSDECHVSRINWFGEMPSDELACTAKFRYRQKDHPVTVKFDNGLLIVKYDYPIASVTPGQEAVFYLGEVCLGGGVIEETFRGGCTFVERMSRGKS
ncbi:MAG: tRNA 2-thiouridine(34) synthase MnmA [Firmicutes bacterium HGW-Firmicutes-10]|nr:MAG: tRNA 2-thiouridine(34) synthase MnmA [Firmicutes bacterium HGW-Firmicutes-10]